MTAGPRIAVVGAGIVGAAIAWHLAARGAQVTVLDAGARGGVATPRSWAWINASWGNPEPYVRLRLQAMADWRDLPRDLPGLSIEWPGGLLWDLPAAELEAYVRQHGGWGYDLRLVGRDDIRSIEPPWPIRRPSPSSPPAKGRSTRWPPPSCCSRAPRRAARRSSRTGR